MDQPTHAAVEPSSGSAPPQLIAYTAFPAAEQLAERYLGSQSPLRLPLQHQQQFVRFLPWLTLAFLPVHLGLVLILLGASALSTLVGVPSALTTIVSLAGLTLRAFSLPGIFRRTRRGWALSTYAMVLTLVTGVLSFSVFGVLISVVTLWLAFQVKHHYA